MNKKLLFLEGLDCANCAAKMEEGISKLPGVSSVHLNIATKKLSIEFGDMADTEKTIAKAKEIILHLESHIKIIDESVNPDSPLTGNLELECGDCKEQKAFPFNKEAYKILFGGALFLLGFLLNLPTLYNLIIFTASYLLVGGEILLRAFKNMLRGQIFDENFLMSIATLGAFAIGEYPEGVAVMLFFQVGEYFQELAVNRSRKSIKDLLDINPDHANLKVEDSITKVTPQEVKVGDTIIIKPGEKIPLDGIVLEGTSSINTSLLTGESLPRDIKGGDTVLSGFININGLLSVKVTKPLRESTATKILELVQNAAGKKAPTEKFITKFARYYTPLVVFTALVLAVTPPLMIRGEEFSVWIYRALVFLVISCPCALVISIPLSFFGGIGGASREGILIKGSNYLEALNNAEIVVFDKTGTLTKGQFEVVNIQGAEGYSREEVLEFAAIAESNSNHPIAKSIIKAYGRKIKGDTKDYKEIPGKGILINHNDRIILAGNKPLLEDNDVKMVFNIHKGTVVHIAVDGKHLGYIEVADKIKEDSKDTIKQLKSLGIKKTVMLTGDKKEEGEEIGKSLGLDKVYAELLPHHKVERFEELENEKSPGGKILYVGDGINDAPVLARADVGIAMGALGSDAAIEAADIVLMTDEPYKLVKAIKGAKKTRKIVMQNIIFSLGVKGIVLMLGAIGIATMWAAVFADVGVAIIAVLNSIRALKID